MTNLLNVFSQFVNPYKRSYEEECLALMRAEFKPEARAIGNNGKIAVKFVENQFGNRTR